MCGIFAFLHYGSSINKFDAVQILLNGLKLLEYRGYDSAGLAIGSQYMELFKAIGPVDNLEDEVNKNLKNKKSNIPIFTGMAHTRWATHGSVSTTNCHPHTSSSENEFVVIHNGIVTNYKDIKNMLEKEGYEFQSDTDTEVIAKLCLYYYKELKKSGEQFQFKDIVLNVTKLIQGASAVIFFSSLYLNEVCTFKRGSPLVLGLKETGDLDTINSNHISHNYSYFLSSDANALIGLTKRVLYIEDNDIIHFNSNGQFKFYNIGSDTVFKRIETTLDSELSTISKGRFDHFMLKEIYEQEESVLNTMRGRINFTNGEIKLGGLSNHIESINRCRRLVFIACGTSFHAALATRQLMEELTDLPVSLENSSDFLDRQTPIFRDDTCFFISQSGETADTIQALEYCKKRGSLCVGITNTVGSTIARLTDCGVYLNAGPEIGVASTKCYTSQIIALILIALKLGQDKISTYEKRNKIIEDMSKLQSYIHETLQLEEEIKVLAKRFVSYNNLLVLGRGYNVATCLEGALKIKEITYIHTEGMNAGELKHGPLALIEPDTPLIMVVTQDNLYSKTQNALHQVISRKGKPIIICTKGDELVKKQVDVCLEVPKISDCLQTIINIIPLQLLSYHIAILKGINVDRPRNLAKSVTVE